MKKTIIILLLIFSTLTFLGSIYYFYFQDDNNQDVLGISDVVGPSIDSNVWLFSMSDDIHENIKNKPLEKYFPRKINNQNILNIYPDDRFLVYPVNKSILFKSDDGSVKEFPLEYAYEGYYLSFNNENQENELPISIKIYKLKDNPNQDEIISVLNYRYDYSADLYNRILMKTYNINIFGGYVPWNQAKDFPLDYRWKTTDFMIYIPENGIVIQLNIAYKDNTNNVYPIVKNYIEYLGSDNNETVDEDEIMQDLSILENIPKFGDQFISRLRN